MVTASPVYGLPSTEVPEPPKIAVWKTAVPLTAAVRLPSYSLLSAVRPVMVSALAVMLAEAVGAPTIVNE